MCGLVGVFGKVTPLLQKAFANFLLIDSVRGMDSTGVAAVDTTFVPRMRKVLGPAPFLFVDRKYKTKIAGRTDHLLLMGHNRAATRGKVEVANAHPFQHGHIILCHNGTLTSTHELCGNKTNPFGTDSEAICNAIAQQGLDWAWKRMPGAAALTWWDMRERTFNFITNGDRPLQFAFLKDRSAVVYASEGWMFREVLARGCTPIALDTVMKLNKNHHFRWRVTEDGKAVVAASREVEPTPIPARQFYRGHLIPATTSRIVHPTNRPNPTKTHGDSTPPLSSQPGTPVEIPPVFWERGRGCWYEKLPGGAIYWREDCRNPRLRPPPIHPSHAARQALLPPPVTHPPVPRVNPGFGTIVPDGLLEVVVGRAMQAVSHEMYDCIVCGEVLQDALATSSYFGLVETIHGHAGLCESCTHSELETRTNPNSEGDK